MKPLRRSERQSPKTLRLALRVGLSQVKGPLARMAGTLALSVVLCVFAFPLLWMFSYSLRSTEVPPPIQIEMFVPPLAWDNYARVLSALPLARYAWNSLLVVAVAVPLTLIVASWSGLAL